MKCPDHLSGEARKEWKRVTAAMEKAGRLDAADRGTLAAYCSTWATYTEADTKVKEGGLVVKTKSGNIIANPYLGVRNTALKMLVRQAAELGLTPRSRGDSAPPVDDAPPPGLE
jgi:P27 family predicted phage terminase small subunit